MAKKRSKRRPPARRVRLGSHMMPSFAAEKPVGLGPGGKLVTLAQVAEAPSLASPLASLEDADQAKLTYERYRREPDFTLGIVEYGNFSKKEVLKHVEDRTPLGEMVIQAELNYVAELVGTLRKRVRRAKGATPAVRPAPFPREWKGLRRPWWKFLRSTALFCENTTDAVTSQAAAYRKAKVHPVFKKRGFNVVVLEGIHDVEAEFVRRAKSRRVVYLSGIGHGNPTTYTGHLNSPILRACRYDRAEVAGKSIHFLSCQTAKELGPDTVRKGARSYAGYHENFTFVWSESNRFWEADSTYDIAMALGRTAEQATRLTIARFNYHIAQVPGTAAATWLTWDRNYLRTPAHGARWGRKSARIHPFLAHPFFEAEEALDSLVA